MTSQVNQDIKEVLSRKEPSFLKREGIQGSVFEFAFSDPKRQMKLISLSFSAR